MVKRVPAWNLDPCNTPLRELNMSVTDVESSSSRGCHDTRSEVGEVFVELQMDS